MKNNTPIWTYLISFLNPVIPSFIIIFLGICLVLWTEIDTDTHEVISQITFMELYYPAVLVGIYFCMAISLLYYYVIRKGSLRPRWWLNVLLVILGYGTIPLLAVIFGPKGPPEAQAVNENADTIVLMNYFNVVVMSVVGFIVLTSMTKKTSNQPSEVVRQR